MNCGGASGAVFEDELWRFAGQMGQCVSWLRRVILDEGIRLSVGTYCWTFHRSADKLRPCPSYSRRRDRINLGPNFNSVPNVVQPHKTWVW